jgi:hypothetical protein
MTTNVGINRICDREPFCHSFNPSIRCHIVAKNVILLPVLSDLALTNPNFQTRGLIGHQGKRGRFNFRNPGRRRGVVAEMVQKMIQFTGRALQLQFNAGSGIAHPPAQAQLEG